MEREPEMEIKNAPVIPIQAKYTFYFFNYIKKHGFNPKNYKNIIELGKNISMSMSQFMKSYEPYFLSRTVTEQDLRRNKMVGAQGYIALNGQIRLTENRPIIHTHVTSRNATSQYEDFDAFDAVVWNPNFFPVPCNSIPFQQQDVFIGCCVPNDAFSSYEYDMLHKLYERLLAQDKQFQFIMHEVPNENKNYYLIKKTNHKRL